MSFKVRPLFKQSPITDKTRSVQNNQSNILNVISKSQQSSVTLDELRKTIKGSSIDPELNPKFKHISDAIIAKKVESESKSDATDDVKQNDELRAEILKAQRELAAEADSDDEVPPTFVNQVNPSNIIRVDDSLEVQAQKRAAREAEIKKNVEYLELAKAEYSNRVKASAERRAKRKLARAELKQNNTTQTHSLPPRAALLRGIPVRNQQMGTSSIKRTVYGMIDSY